MIDAYDLNQTIRNMWSNLARMVSGDSVKKSFPPVPVYVNVDGKLFVVSAINEVDGKIIMDIE
jgi:hypothetical protein